jgi:ACT domain
MVGVPGTASAIFTTVRDAGVNVIMISQASSEHSVCFAVKANEADRAVECLRKRWRARFGVCVLGPLEFAPHVCEALAARFRRVLTRMSRLRGLILGTAARQQLCLSVCLSVERRATRQSPHAILKPWT